VARRLQRTKRGGKACEDDEDVDCGWNHYQRLRPRSEKPLVNYKEKSVREYVIVTGETPARQ
jgi:hypothetical protein